MSEPVITVVGYGTVEHSLLVGGTPRPDSTTLVSGRHTGSAGRIGGCSVYVATGLAQSGLPTRIITWVGDDPAGDLLSAAVANSGVDITGVVRRVTTSEVWMFYEPGGGCYCIYDPGDALDAGLTPLQAQQLAMATWVVVTIGPPEATGVALRVLRPDQQLVWAVKADPGSCPPALGRALAERADVITHSHGEVSWLHDMLGRSVADAAKDTCLVVATRGSESVRWSQGPDRGEVPVSPRLPAADATGAGDRLVAGIVTALIEGADPDRAVRRGVELAVSLLARRHQEFL